MTDDGLHRPNDADRFRGTASHGLLRATRYDEGCGRAGSLQPRRRISAWARAHGVSQGQFCSRGHPLCFGWLEAEFGRASRFC